MIFTITNIILIILLVGISYQDIRSRQIHIFLLSLLLLITVILNYLTKDINYIDTIKIIGFVLINITGLFVYYSIKFRQLINPIDKFLGLGDIIFLIAVSPLFTLNKFILFFVTGLLFSLFTHLIIKNFSEKKTIPLAGYLSIYLLVFMGVTIVSGHNLFIDGYR